MNRRFHIVIAGLLSVLAVAAGWRICHLMMADSALAQGDVDKALNWLPGHPEALMQRANAQIARKQMDAASVTAKHLLQVEPSDGRGYRVLAQVAVALHQPDRARKLFQIASRRAPRDLPARAWLAQDALDRGDPVQALVQIDQVLTLSPAAGATLYPVLVTLAADPRFANALASTLRRPPPWRDGMLAALRQSKASDRPAADQVLSALQRNGGFSAEETDSWLESLLQQGRWSEAYARWASPIISRGEPLPLLYNGNFAHPPSGVGFDWHLPVIAGVIVQLEAGEGADNMMHARLLGRRVAGAFLEHRLLLAPGRYRMVWRERTETMQGEGGIGWQLSCEGNSELVARSDPMTGTSPWRPLSMTVEIPASGCIGQWLRLSPAGARGAGQILSGDLWLSDIKLTKER